MADYKIIDAVSSKYVPSWGNAKKYIAVHYLGCVGENHELASDGCGAHYYIYYDGTIYQRCDHDAIVWQVGTAGCYTQKHAEARNANCIGIEMCVKCDGDSTDCNDLKWYFTEETQNACVWLVKKLMSDLGIAADHVLRHYDVVNKVCPAPYVHNNKYKTSWTWDEFKAKIGGEEVKWYRIRKTWADADSQLGAYEILDNAILNCPYGYSVFDSSGTAVYTPTIDYDTMTAKDLSGSEADKVAMIAPIYQKCMADTGMLASVGLAQFCLESGYGTTDLAQNANNLHGMKCSLSGNTWANSTWDGKSKYTKQTEEQDANGNPYYVTADFRKYPCIKDSVYDRAAYFIGAMNGSSLRYPGIADIKDATEQIKLIKAGGYATDVNYVSKLTNLVERFNLTQYDSGEIGSTSVSWYRVRKSWEDESSQLGAFYSKDNAINLAAANPGYNVYDADGNVVYKSEVPAEYRVQCGAFEKKSNAEKQVSNLKTSGFDAFVFKEDGMYKVQIGLFTEKANADALIEAVRLKGFDAFIK